MRFRHSPLRSRAALIAVTLGFAAACDRGVEPTAIEAPPPDISAFVVGEAAASLAVDGLFPYAGPTRDRGERIISPEQAGEQALGYVRAFGQFFHRGWEKEAGRSIHLPSLQVHPRVFYAEAPYGRFPEGPFHPGYRKGFGPVYLVTLTDGRSPVLLIGVSAYNTDVSVDERGLVVTPQDGGNAFVSFGLPTDTAKYTRLTPEHAVERMGRRTGARVVRPPRLVQMSAFDHPVLALWELPTDRPVPVRAGRDGARRSVNVLYLNGRGRYMIPADEQPGGFSDRFLIGPPWDPVDRRSLDATVPILPGMATQWVYVEPEAALEHSTAGGA